MQYTDYTQTGAVSRFMYKVFGWMAVGLSFTAIVAYMTFATPQIFQFVFSNPIVFYGLLFAQIGLVFWLSSSINRLSYGAASAIFVTYSCLMGLTLSSIFFVFTASSIYLAFAVAAGVFGAMALYGYVTQADLTAVGSYAIMGLIGIIIASIINFFFKSTQLEYVLSLLIVGVFTILTAYDAQRIKQLGMRYLGLGETEQKVALLGALTFYLDFINIFLALLQLFGKRKN